MPIPISGLPSLVVPGDNDPLAIVDSAGAITKKITRANLLKGAPLPADTVTAVAIANGAITNAKLNTATGELGGSWQSWTPSWSSVTIGNAIVSAKYSRVGKTITCRIQVTLGTTSSFGVTVPSFTLPLTAASYLATSYLGQARYDSGGGKPAFIRYASTTNADIVSVSNTSPVSEAALPALGTNATISGTFVYEAA